MWAEEDGKEDRVWMRERMHEKVEYIWCDNGPGSLVPLVAASGFPSRPEHHQDVLNTRRSLQEDAARKEW